MSAFHAMRLPSLLAIAAFAVTAAQAAPSVYKCKKAGVVIFSEQPCGKDAKEVDTSRALMTGTSPNVQGISDSAAMSRIDGECSDRERAINNQTAQYMETVDREIVNLNVGALRSTNNYAAAAGDNGNRAQITAAENRKSAATQAQRSQLAELKRDCDEKRTAEIRSQKDRDEKARLEAEQAAARVPAPAAPPAATSPAGH